MAKTKTGMTAFTICIFSTFFTGLAFVSNGWLVTDGELENPQFLKIGLWIACFNNFKEPHNWYDTNFRKCLLVYEKELRIIEDVVLKKFFIATQVWFTACIILTLAAVWQTGMYMYLNREKRHFVRVLFKTGACYTSAAVCGTIALIIFGVNGRGREWMPDWEHNAIGYSYGLAVIGVVGHYICGLLFAIEGRARMMERQRKKTRESVVNNELFALDDFDMTVTVPEV